MVIKIVAKIKKVLLDFTFINIIDDYQKSHYIKGTKSL